MLRKTSDTILEQTYFKFTSDCSHFMINKPKQVSYLEERVLLSCSTKKVFGLKFPNFKDMINSEHLKILPNTFFKCTFKSISKEGQNKPLEN